MGDVGDDSAVTAAFGCKGYGCFDLWKHGTCSELIFCDIFVGIVHRNSIQQSLIVCIFVEADFFDAGEDQKCICIKFFCKKLTGKVFFDDGTCTVKVDALLHNRDSAAAGSDNNLSCICKSADGFEFDNFLRLRCCKDSVTDLVISYQNLKKTSIKKNLLHFNRQKADRFVAVKGISFYVREGEILGIIGKNGCGKSTTLNALAGIFSPDSGTIDLHGHSISLLSIGVGFQREMTGRENITLSGMLLGFSEEQVKEKEAEIVEFAELGDFIDMPVRTYSSGMYSKLAFSITAILETDIMLIDEVLSVGDQKFKKKSYEKMKSLISNKDRTVIIVSHSLDTLEELCDTVMWMHDGQIRRIGEPKPVLEEYVDFMEKN